MGGSDVQAISVLVGKFGLLSSDNYPLYPGYQIIENRLTCQKLIQDVILSENVGLRHVLCMSNVHVHLRQTIDVVSLKQFAMEMIFNKVTKGRGMVIFMKLVTKS